MGMRLVCYEKKYNKKSRNKIYGSIPGCGETRIWKKPTSRRAKITSREGEVFGIIVPVTNKSIESFDSRAWDMSPRATATPRGELVLWDARLVGGGCTSRGSRT